MDVGGHRAWAHLSFVFPAASRDGAGVVRLNIVIITFRPAIVISMTLVEKGGFSIEQGKSWEPILQTTATFKRKLVDLALCVPRGICEGDTRKIQANALTLRLINLIHCKFRSVLNEKI